MERHCWPKMVLPDLSQELIHLPAGQLHAKVGHRRWDVRKRYQLRDWRLGNVDTVLHVPLPLLVYEFEELLYHDHMYQQVNLR